jgi:hypothetical protein
LNLYNQIVSLALFHRVRLQARPGPTSNRFYLLVKKEMRENN